MNFSAVWNITKPVFLHQFYYYGNGNKRKSESCQKTKQREFIPCKEQVKLQQVEVAFHEFLVFGLQVDLGRQNNLHFEKWQVVFYCIIPAAYFYRGIAVFLLITAVIAKWIP
jgi:hypothetical protein